MQKESQRKNKIVEAKVSYLEMLPRLQKLELIQNLEDSRTLPPPAWARQQQRRRPGHRQRLADSRNHLMLSQKL